MSLDPQNAMKSFSKGSLPGWISSLLLLLLCYFGKRVMEEFDSMKHDQLTTRERVQALEFQGKAMETAIIELRMGQKDVVSELRAINTQLQKR